MCFASFQLRPAPPLRSQSEHSAIREPAAVLLEGSAVYVLFLQPHVKNATVLQF